ncbi:MAG TPA: DUF6527 family protein [Polyangiaceae bacterium]|nr:DUF6527 family protein [Polyangiaceae bacterium]
MKRTSELTHEFVESFPDNLREGVLYVSVTYASASHRCCCGCGLEVVTPLTPTDWKMIFDGKTVSLDPSVGNWSFPCRSHYWVKRNKIHWAPAWSQEQIDAGRRRDRMAKDQQFETNLLGQEKSTLAVGAAANTTPNWWQRLKVCWSRRTR